jgi:hypothetical protein
VRVRQMIALPRLNPRPELWRNEFCFRHRLRDAVKALNAPRERRRHRAYHEEPTKLTMTAPGYKATRWGGPSNVRLCLRKGPILLTTAAHNDLFVDNVCFVIRKRTFAVTNLNDGLGSIPAFRCALQAPRWKTVCGYTQSFEGGTSNVCSYPQSRLGGKS